MTLIIRYLYNDELSDSTASYLYNISYSLVGFEMADAGSSHCNAETLHELRARIVPLFYPFPV